MEISDAHTLSSWASTIINFLESKGYSKEKLLTSAGLDPKLLDSAQARYPVTGISKLWHYAYDQYGTTVGLQIARYFRPNHWSTLGLALQSSRNVDEFIYRICRYVCLISNAVELRFEESDVGAKKVTTRFLQPVSLENERMESYMASALGLTEMMYGKPPKLIRVDLPRVYPSDPTPWYEVFGDNIQWESAAFTVHLSRAVLDFKTPNIDSRIALMHETDLSERLEQLHNLSFSQRIRREVLQMLPNGEPSVKDVAERLHMSPRSMQRHLEEEGIGFRQLIDSVRLQVAKNYLTLTRHSLSEIALLTGFSNQSNFSNAFKRWTDLTPNRYRDQHQQSPNRS